MVEKQKVDITARFYSKAVGVEPVVVDFTIVQRRWAIKIEEKKMRGLTMSEAKKLIKLLAVGKYEEYTIGNIGRDTVPNNDYAKDEKDAKLNAAVAELSAWKSDSEKLVGETEKKLAEMRDWTRVYEAYQHYRLYRYLPSKESEKFMNSMTVPAKNGHLGEYEQNYTWMDYLREEDGEEGVDEYNRMMQAWRSGGYLQF